MIDEEKLLHEVSQWLASGGLVFEMEVARRVAKRAWIMTQGDHYIDPTTRDEREIDVKAYLNFGMHSESLHVVEILAECKATTAPWIVFSGQAWENGPFDPVVYAEDDCSVCETIYADLHRLRRDLPSGYAIAAKRTEVKGGQDHAYQAVQQVTNATLAAFGDIAGWTGHVEKIATVFALPIVVTRSPIVVCSLADGGEIELKLANMAEVAMRRLDLPVGREGQPQPEGVSVLVVHIDALDALMSELEGFVARIARGERSRLDLN